MATNPMQRKARISFILGMLVMLLLCGIVIGFLFIQLTNYQKKEKENRDATVNVYALSQDVQSGQVITDDMYSKIEVNRNLVPSNAIEDLIEVSNFALEDKEGNKVITKYDKKDENGKVIGTLYLQKKAKNGSSQPNEVELKKETETGNYYTEENGTKEYVELNSVPVVAKIEMKANTVITTELLEREDNRTADDVRKEEYNMLILPIDLKTGDYVDVRLMLPNGQNYIVVSKKEVEVPKISTTDVADTIWFNTSEDELLTMSSAIVDAYKIAGSKLYVTKYTEAGMQKAATPTYVVTDETLALLAKDPNVLQKAKEGLKERYTKIDSSNIRNEYIQKSINQNDQAEEDLKTKMQESIQITKENREKYLESLSGVVE